MRHINMDTWPRRTHFNKFVTFTNPHFSMCANVDMTIFFAVIKQRKISFTVAVMYTIAKVANEIPEFRYRIRKDKVIEHDIVHPSATIMADENLFTFCSVGYDEDFTVFADRAAEQIRLVRENITLEDEPGQDDLLFMSSIPWVSFTSFMHPLNLEPADSVPRFAWGKMFEDNAVLKMPLSVQGHHALMDGVHVGMFYTTIQQYFNEPDTLLGKA